MKIRLALSLTSPVLAVISIVIGFCGIGMAQEPASPKQPTTKPESSTAKTASVGDAQDILKRDEGSWDADVTFWPRPGSKPIKSHAVVTSRMTLDGKYLEQRFDGKFGPEMGDKAWNTLSYTGFNTETNQFETVRMASSNSPMFVVRGKATHGDAGVTMELVGEYTLMGSKATERDVIRHEGPGKCVIESWMSFKDSGEFKGSEMVLTRAVSSSESDRSNSQSIQPKGDSPMLLGNFSVSLAVKDLQVSRAFYEKLGFHSVFGNEKNFLIMQNDSSTIGLFQGMFDKNILTYNPGWDRNGATLTDFDDVRAIQRKLKEQGIELTTTADESTSDPASITFLDPDGNMILIDQHGPKPNK